MSGSPKAHLTHTHPIFVFITFPKGSTCQDVIHPQTPDSHKETGGTHHIHQAIATPLSMFLLSLEDSPEIILRFSIICNVMEK